MSTVLDKATTGIASFDKYHPTLKRNMAMLKEMAAVAERNDGIALSEYRPDSEWGKALAELVVVYAPGVYAVPYLHPSYCAEILKEVSKFSFEPNEDEPEEAQIPEVVLQDQHKVLFEVFRSFWMDAGLAYSKLLLNLVPENIRTIQAARYTPTNTAQGNWHTDRDSDVTLVVALNIDDVVGGGTWIHQGPFANVRLVDQLDTGWALLFCGKTTLHKGARIEEGERNLLVHWTEVK